MTTKTEKLEALNVDKMIFFFKALANEDRFQIVKLLKEKNETFAQDIEKHFYLEQSTTSHHLNLLKRAGVAKSEKKGRKVFYSLDLKAITLMLDDLKVALNEI